MQRVGERGGENGASDLRDVPKGANAVGSGPAVGGKLKEPRERAIVGEQEEPLRVQVEAPAGNHPRQEPQRRRREHGRAAQRVRVRRHQAGRLVEPPQPGCRRGGAHKRAAHGQRVPRRVDEGGAGRDHAPVDGHQTLLDEPLGLPPGRNSCTGEYL